MSTEKSIRIFVQRRNTNVAMKGNEHVSVFVSVFLFSLSTYSSFICKLIHVLTSTTEKNIFIPNAFYTVCNSKYTKELN